MHAWQKKWHNTQTGSYRLAAAPAASVGLGTESLSINLCGKDSYMQWLQHTEPRTHCSCSWFVAAWVSYAATSRRRGDLAANRKGRQQLHHRTSG